MGSVGRLFQRGVRTGLQCAAALRERRGHPDLIPSTAPLGSDERYWLSGYLTGLLTPLPEPVEEGPTGGVVVGQVRRDDMVETYLDVPGASGWLKVGARLRFTRSQPPDVILAALRRLHCGGRERVTFRGRVTELWAALSTLERPERFSRQAKGSRVTRDWLERWLEDEPTMPDHTALVTAVVGTSVAVTTTPNVSLAAGEWIGLAVPRPDVEEDANAAQ